MRQLAPIKKLPFDRNQHTKPLQEKNMCLLGPTELLKYSLFDNFPSHPTSSCLVFVSFASVTLTTLADIESPD